MMELRRAKQALMWQVIVVSIAVFLCSGIGHTDQLHFACTYQWAKTFGGSNWDGAHAIQQTEDGGFIVAGYGDWPYGDLWVLKLEEDGDIEWRKSYGQTLVDKAHAIQQTEDGGFIVAGETYSGQSGSGDIDFWVLKLKENGDIEWQKTYGEDENESASSIQQTKDGGFIVAGETRSFTDLGLDLLVLKLDELGNVQWQKAYGFRCFDYVHAIQQTKDGGYVLAGEAMSLYPGEEDAIVIKLMENGDIEWQKTYGSTEIDSAYAIQQTKDGGFIVAGKSNHPTDLWMLKLEEDGDIAWDKTYGTAESDWGTSVQQTEDAGYIVAGGSSGDVWVLRFRENGDLAWQKRYGGVARDGASSVNQTEDGGYVVAGSTDSFGLGESDFWMLKLHGGGNIPDCPAVLASTATEGLTDAVVSAAGFSERDVSVLIDPTTVTEEIPDATPTDVCFGCTRVVLERVVSIDSKPFVWPHWFKRMKICIEWPSGVGVGLPRPCPPVDYCPQCGPRLSQDAIGEKIPEYLHDLYRAVLPILITQMDAKFPKDAIKRIEESFMKPPTGPYFTEKLKASTKTTLGELRSSRKATSELRGKLVAAINAVELDLGVPTLPAVKVKAEKYSTADFKGVAWAAFRNLKESGKASLKINQGLPASAAGFIPVWPIASYDFNFSGTLVENGYIDVSFYVGGVNVFGQLSDLHILQWDGKSYRDITVNVDKQRSVITGRTNKLSTFVIMSELPK
jgi:hypothetical protein